MKNCKRLDCPLSHELSPHILSPNGQYKNLFVSVVKIFEHLFQTFITIQNDNLALKFALMKFYQKTASNKFKIIQIATELEKKNLTFRQRSKIYEMKRYVADMQITDLTHNLKVEDSFDSFSNFFIIQIIVYPLWCASLSSSGISFWKRGWIFKRYSRLNKKWPPFWFQCKTNWTKLFQWRHSQQSESWRFTPSFVGLS